MPAAQTITYAIAITEELWASNPNTVRSTYGWIFGLNSRVPGSSKLKPTIARMLIPPSQQIAATQRIANDALAIRLSIKCSYYLSFRGELHEPALQQRNCNFCRSWL